MDEDESPPEPDIEELAESAQEIIASDDVLGLFADDFARFVAGESKNAKLLFLAATSRLFDHGETMHVAVKGPSAGGKSEIRKRVLEFFPPEDVIGFTSLSEKSLIYMGGGFEHKILSMDEAADADELKFQDLLLRQLMSEGRLVHSTVQKVDGELVTIAIEKNGPVVFMVTTTKAKLHPENETRLLSLEVDDSAEQTRQVLRQIAQLRGLNREKTGTDEILRAWRDFQRWLALGERRVFVPFARVLADLITDTRSVRLRRDFPQMLVAIKAHALLHREQRRRSTKDAIVATIEDDYAVVRRLMAEVMATAIEAKMHKAVAETVAVVKEITEAPRAANATVRMVADRLNVDRSAASRRLRVAEEAGLIINMEESKGHRRTGLYQLSGEVPREVEMLPTAEVLDREYWDEREKAARTSNSSRSSASDLHKQHKNRLSSTT
jgi:hypothetical protein